MTAVREATDRCGRCGAARKADAAFCTSCGEPASAPAIDRESHPRNLRKLLLIAGATCLVGAIAALLAIEHRRADREHAARVAAVAEVSRRVKTLDGDLTALRTHVKQLSLSVADTEKQVDAGLAPLAARILRSVFTVETFAGSGSAWAAWERDGATFLVTANHVVEGITDVTLRRKGGTWKGKVVRTDATNDLALIRAKKLKVATLWDDAASQPAPNPGDELVLVGSPYGLEGTVTTGIVSRVTYNRIQTDAAANPGNSGGPAVNLDGAVVGILVAGGGENLNFAIPIQRACVTLRSC
jgi:S1-C subfamily serine protease